MRNKTIHPDFDSFMDDFALGWLITSLIFLIVLCAPLKYILLHNNKNKRQQHSFLNIILKQTEYPSHIRLFMLTAVFSRKES